MAKYNNLDSMVCDLTKIVYGWFADTCIIENQANINSGSSADAEVEYDASIESYKEYSAISTFRHESPLIYCPHSDLPTWQDAAILYPFPRWVRWFESNTQANMPLSGHG